MTSALRRREPSRCIKKAGRRQTFNDRARSGLRLINAYFASTGCAINRQKLGRAMLWS